MLIALAGLTPGWSRSALLLMLGIAGLVLFFRLDARSPASRLFPSRPFAMDTTSGAGMLMIACFAISTCSFALYGPLLLTSLHGIPILTTGYIIAAESMGWSALSILVSNAPRRFERAIILTGALMITAGLAGFAYAVPSGSIPLILACAVLQGGGFGIAWPFITRAIVAAAPQAESTIAASAVSTMPRMGYAVGSALTGMLANMLGFSHGLNAATAASVAAWLFIAFLPLALLGCVAAFRLTTRMT
jgi:MFS family permease